MNKCKYNEMVIRNNVVDHKKRFLKNQWHSACLCFQEILSKKPDEPADSISRRWRKTDCPRLWYVVGCNSLSTPIPVTYSNSEWVSVEFYIILETSLSRQSLALVLTTQNRQEKIHQKHKKKHKTNKLALGKKHTKHLNQQAQVHLLLVRTFRVCVLMTVYNCST